MAMPPIIKIGNTAIINDLMRKDTSSSWDIGIEEALHKPRTSPEIGRANNPPCNAHLKGFWPCVRPIHPNQTAVNRVIIQGAIIHCFVYLGTSLVSIVLLIICLLAE